MHRRHYCGSVSYLAFILSLAVLSDVTYADVSLPPRLSVNGYASDYTVGEADLMLPLSGDRRHNFYLDPNIAYATDNQGYADLGLGYRWIKNDTAILGFYLFGGYTRIDNNARLCVLNPGIEALGSNWDSHLNAYFPMGNRHQPLGATQRIYFTGHSELTDLIQLAQYAGNGADVQLGYQPFPESSLKAYVGSYFFNPAQASNIWGGAVGLEYWMDNYVKAFASYTYDNLRHSTGAFGLGIEWGGTHTERIHPTLEERITDPVQRYLADLGRGSVIPSRIKTQPIPGSSQTLLNNIAFFSQTGGPNNGGAGLTLANCTFENPCGPTDLTNLGTSTLASLLPNTQLYFNGGSYNATGVVGGIAPVMILSGQSIFSRSTDYSQPATGADRSTFVGRLSLAGNNTISNIIVNSPPDGGSPGIGMLSNASDILITGSQVGSSTDINLQPIVGIGSSGTVPFNNSAVIENTTVYAQDTGINFGGPSLTVRNSTINAGGIHPTSTGVRTTGTNGVINLEDTEINVNSSVSTMDIGIQAGFPGSQITANNVTINLYATAPGAETNALLVGNNTTSITVNQANITANSPSGSAYIVGGTAGSTGQIDISQSTLAVNAPTAMIQEPTSATNLTINSSRCTVNGSSVVC